MIIKIYAVGLFSDNKPHLKAVLGDDPFIPVNWQLVHTQEVHLNIDADQLMEKCLFAKELEAVNE